MRHEVRLHPTAVKFLRELDEKTRNRIKKSLYQLREDPIRSRPGADIKRLKGTRERHEFFRLRIGDYRVIYAIDKKTVWVTDVFVRGRDYQI